jgi:hypothetical protein
MATTMPALGRLLHKHIRQQRKTMRQVHHIHSKVVTINMHSRTSMATMTAMEMEMETAMLRIITMVTSSR